MAMDPILLEIMNRKVEAIADEICTTVLRTSRSVFVNEAADFAAGLIDLKGEMFGWPPSSKTTQINVPAKYTVDMFKGKLEDGDCIVTNDPYLSDGMATHLPDLHILRPYFHKGKLVCYGWGFIHFMDVGGRIPGSIAASNHEVFQEGFRIPPMKLMKKGVFNEDFMGLFRANCRLPDINERDLMAMTGALQVGAKRVSEVIDHYGVKTFIDCQGALKDYAAAKVREVIKKLPNGKYDFWEYVDDDYVSRVPIRVRLRMTIDNGSMHFDVTGTDPQVAACYNVPTQGTLHNFLTRRITTFFRTHDKTIPLNAGTYRPMSATNPPGTVLHAEFPDAVGDRFVTATAFNDAVTGVLLKASSDLMAGPTCGSGGSIILSEYKPGNDFPSVIFVQTMRGGMSAYKGHDGVDTRDVTMNTMPNHPIETIEEKCGVKILEYDIRADSGGAGTWRGGCGQTMTLEVLRDGGKMQVRGTERFRFPPYGVMGGRAGQPIKVIMNRGQATEKVIGKVEEFPVNAGDTITISLAGAAGFGDPFARDPAAVRKDVEIGYVSVEAAKREYGVVVNADGSAIDQAATQATRLGRTKSNIGQDFDFGPERLAWEKVFDDATMLDLNRKLAALPKAIRTKTRRWIFEQTVPDLPKAGHGSVLECLADPDKVRARLRSVMSEAFAKYEAKAAE
ncbi:MAG: hydantoinase B/oxoprolinase family protein [Rhodospirillales bacterium]|nr:hydantoinase B/oxoprolinase family protein [Rhodospirillales bacterium]